jgi:hypothetical protein
VKLFVQAALMLSGLWAHAVTIAKLQENLNLPLLGQDITWVLIPGTFQEIQHLGHAQI